MPKPGNDYAVVMCVRAIAGTYVNIMDQWQSFNYPLLDRSITKEEFEEAVEAAKAAGLHRLHHERPGSAVAWIAEV